MAKESLTVVYERLNEGLTMLAVKAKKDAEAGMDNAYKQAEPMIRNLMNTLYGYDLKLEEKVNAAGFDLCDRGNRVFVQVTGNCTMEKIESCLKTTAGRVKKDESLKDFRLYIAFLTAESKDVQNLRKKTLNKLKKGEWTAEGFGFDTADILCLEDFIQMFRDDEGPEGAPLTAEQVCAVQEILEKHAPGAAETLVSLNLPLPSTMKENHFVGREQELEAIAKGLQESKLVFLSGLGGMGKTELAVKFGREYRGGQVYFVRFQESFTRTVTMNVALGIEGLMEQGPEIAYAEAMKRLGQCGENDILILDNADEASGNFDNLKDDTWQKLRQLNMKLLITTRCDVPGAVKVGAMKTELLRQLFRNQELVLEVPQMDDLIDAVKGHTMMVDMMAKTLRRNRRLTAEHLLQTIKDGTLPAERLRAIAMEKNGNMEQEQIYVHLKNLFSMANLSEGDKAMLTYLVLLPDGGLDMEVLEEIFTEEGLDDLENLIESGWLHYEPRTKRVSMHPVVSLVCREELKPDDENCSAFLEAVWRLYDWKQYSADRFRQYAELFSSAADTLLDWKGTWATWAGYLWHDLAQMEKELWYNKQAVEQRKISMPNSRELATAYNNLGVSYQVIGNFQKAFGYHTSALEIQQTIFPGENSALAHSYTNIGAVYGYMGQPHAALEYHLKALDVSQKDWADDHPDMATMYLNVGYGYSNLGRYEEALKYQLKSLEVFKKNLPPDHPKIANAHTSVGLTYNCLQKYEQALEQHEMALRIRVGGLPENHPLLAETYNNMGLTHGYLGNYQRAMELHLKATNILEKTLPRNHPTLAMNYNNVGLAYLDLQNHIKAMEYQVRALEIRKEILHPNHPDMANSFNNIGTIYFQMGNYPQALQYMLRGLDVLKAVYHSVHPTLAASYGNIGELYGFLGEYENALSHMKCALEIAEKSLHEGHPSTEYYQNRVQHFEGVLQLLAAFPKE